jgi:hypothetical protein
MPVVMHFPAPALVRPVEPPAGTPPTPTGPPVVLQPPLQFIGAAQK